MYSIALFLLLGAVDAYNFIQPDMGVPCKAGQKGSLPGIKYYYDKDTNEIFPFYYKGCGGNDNRFNTREEAPVQVDDQPCPGYPDPNGACNIYKFNGFPLKNCSTGYYCVMSWTGLSGYCCDAGARDRSEANMQAPMCTSKHQKPVTYIYRDDTHVLLGRNCTHEFCPTRSRCYQGEFYGYCCINP